MLIQSKCKMITNRVPIFYLNCISEFESFVAKYLFKLKNGQDELLGIVRDLISPQMPQRPSTSIDNIELIEF